jgi:GNAT superfamily N-acetyltransferase
LNEDHSHLFHFKEWAEKGLGSKLLKALERWLMEQGAELITLETRLGTIPLFMKTTYKETARSPRYYGRTPALRMRKK